MKKILFAALAGALMFSCQKAGEKSSATDGDTKKVSITIKKEASTRSLLGQDVPEGAVTALTAGTLYFFDANGGTVYSYPLTAADIAKAGIDNYPYGTGPDDVSATGFEVEVPVTSRSVAMIANPATGLASSPQSFGAFKLLSFDIASQASMAGEAGVVGTGEVGEGEPVAVQGVALLDAAGSNTGNAANPLLPGPDQSKVNTAAITLVPAVARIEIAANAVAVKPNNETNLSAFDFTGIYVNNYALSYSLGHAAGTPFFGSTLVDRTDTSVDWATAYTALPDASEFFYNQNNAGTIASGGYAFHVFPGEPPQIALRGDDFTYAGVTEPKSATQYWIIEDYYEANEDGSNSGVKINTFAPGYVYKIKNILVGKSHPKDDPYDEPVSVTVTVTVQAWHVQNVFVEPN